MFKYGTDRPDGTKRDGDEPEETGRRAKRTNKNKEKQQKRLETRMARNAETVSADDELQKTKPAKKGSVRRTIHKPITPSNIGIQKLYEEFTNARNKNMITADDFKEFDEEFQKWKQTKGKDKSRHRLKAKHLYKNNLYPKLKKTV